MENELKIKYARDYMKNAHKDDYTGHDVAHVERVYALALHIAHNEGNTNTLIIELATLLHDTVDNKITDEKLAYSKLVSFLKSIELTDEEIKHILHIIQHMSYRGGKNNNIEMSIDGKIVRDADRLDALGAIGIARTFQFAGHFGEPMWTEMNMPFESIQMNEIDKYDASAIKHFYEKLLKLKDLMHTSTGMQLAEERHTFMIQFLKQFLNEWNFKE
ncbi:HD domain-containing protein [Staphylococcus caprae]|uniref:HD domain-containing protein n=2 Tax=Staphylococcus caprae TaxID=29380 RepID=A0ABN5W2C7_9STAP|nr:HD domain-containing protein [Staphylococcus caprae]MBN6827002.1 HD domain-containing protein [Staphylococcus caprae]MBX5316300.1 HD domain-containing protein [Staphylococcus caprae]MBX5324259.1 HD domain-containing protein [Staphylococcus caprae]MDI0015739.1 HD domain-containing protein [Staphylococcus caprae]MEB8095788.1 HD domain-containing protein [Staphylococcus caprae]